MLHFQYMKDLLHDCARDYNAGGTSTSSTSTHSPSIPSTFDWSESDNDSNCLRLYLQHQANYNRSSHHTQNEERYAIFLENVAFVHEHNNLYLESETHYHHVTLNQFSDRLNDELPLAEFPLPTEKIKDWKINEKTPRSHGDSHDRYWDKDWFQKVKFVKRKRRKHQQNLLLLSLKDKKIEMFRKRYPDFQKNGDDWATYLNWASTDNPDGLNLVHPVSDQVSEPLFILCSKFLFLPFFDAISYRV